MEWIVQYDADADRGTIKMLQAADDPAQPIAPVVLQFQHGPIGDNGINGIQNEELLDLLTLRLRALDERAPCDENKLALENIAHAHAALRARTKKRQAQGVEGTEAAHVS